MTAFKLAVAFALIWAPAIADKSQYADVSPEMHQWFQGLRNKSGAPCCDLSDGRTVEDPDWEFDGQHFKVKVDGDWHLVPPDAVLGLKNKYGLTVVWMVADPFQVGKRRVLCFLPGAMT